MNKHPRAVNWISALLFISLGSFLCAWIFEWNRHYFNCDPGFHIMSTADKALLFWFIAAKTLSWFLPFIAVYLCLISLEFFRIATCFLNILCLFTFLITITDILAYSISGEHAWAYFEFLTAGIMETPQLVFSRIWHFGGIRLIGGAILLLAVFVISQLAFFFFIRGIVSKAAYRFVWLTSRRSLVILTSCFVLFCLGIIPLADQFRDRVVDILPIMESHKKLLQYVSGSVKVIFDITKHDFLPLKAPDNSVVLNSEDERFVANLVEDAVNSASKGAYSPVIVNRPDFPNVVLIVLESFRPYTVGIGCMKDLSEWAKQGLQLQKHYSGSNTTRPGLFSLFSGQVPLGQIRNREIGFRMIKILKRAGYECTFITYRDPLNIMGIEDWYRSIPFDNFFQDGNYSMRQEEFEDWPDSDIRKMKQALRILNSSNDKPMFITVFLISSHVPYAFPREMPFFKSTSFWRFFDPKYKISEFVDRYTNSMIFLEKQIMQFIQQLDLNRNIIIITGDHGESMKEDGVFFHGGRPSEVQLRVPFIMVGPGIKPRQIHTATSHCDVLPTLLHLMAGEHLSIPGSCGRDLLDDPSPVDQVIVAPYLGNPNSQDILFIHGDKRLVFRTSIDPDNSKRLEFVGAVDETGQYKLRGKLIVGNSQ